MPFGLRAVFRTSKRFRIIWQTASMYFSRVNPSRIVLFVVGVFLFTHVLFASSAAPHFRVQPRHRNFTFVTFGSQSFFDNLENVIGSIHFWAAGTPVVVYNLGLSPHQIASLKCLLGVQVIEIDFSKYPPHLKNLYTYSWKPIVYQDAVNRFGKVLLLDSGIEVRGRLDDVFDAIDTAGYFFVEADTNHDKMDEKIHPGMFESLNVDRRRFANRKMCYAGIHGYHPDSFVVHDVLNATVQCALRAECIDPLHAGHDNHRYEQAAFSVFMRLHGVYCHSDGRFREDRPFAVSFDAFQENQETTFFFRRWRYPKPYSSMLSRICVSEASPDDSNAVSLLESTATTRHQSNEGLVHCLQANAGDRSKCEMFLSPSIEDKPYSMGTRTFARYGLVRGYLLGLLGIFFYALRTWVLDSVCILLLAYFVWGRPWRVLRVKEKYHDRDLEAASAHRRSGSSGLPSYSFCFRCPQLSDRSKAWLSVFVITLCSLTLFFRHHTIFAWYYRRTCSHDSEGSWSIGIMHFSRTLQQNGLHLPQATPVSIVDCSLPNDIVTTFVADPFLSQKPNDSSTWYLFFEAKDALTRSLVWNGHAVISAAASTDRGRTWVYDSVVLREPFHLSYPSVFWVGGVPYLVPESHNSLSVRLYTTLDFPRRWIVTRELLYGDHYVDPTIFQYDNRWYMYTTIAGHPIDLLLFHSDSLFGPWVPHPLSPVVRNSARFARSAGLPMIDAAGRLIRFAQDGTEVYGAAVYVLQVTELSATTYVERLLYSDPLLEGSRIAGSWNPRRMHHINMHVLDQDWWIAAMDGD